MENIKGKKIQKVNCIYVGVCVCVLHEELQGNCVHVPQALNLYKLQHLLHNTQMYSNFFRLTYGILDMVAYWQKYQMLE